ncbi:hypothetical protein PV518_34890 [Streptomyces sp. ND04-05B]|uniref:hypothetical protein n=1 Tax=Streptomyces sp. ND04-05B TaxID=3028693 RepID=UPI0029A4946E|nr:hypothetical protein [Streptomyces sp. ND04-05B]MDX3067301.1 hypothetical protein [Streptomyces sp. ND04-05B]
MSDEPGRPGGTVPPNEVMATFSAWLDHAVACKDACRRDGVSCLESMRLARRHRAARKAAGRARPNASDRGR